MKSKAKGSQRLGPQVGQPVRGSGSGRPIMVVLDLLGRRSALRLLWELREGAPLTFRALQEAAETNPSLLNTRLRELREAGIVIHQGEGYTLSPSGLELLQALSPLAQWAEVWGERELKERRSKGKPE
ncbi:winged helix-turn-helix transcriptional regulator [Ketobacter sp.]|uniref:winged helix-turn-helix transcriptional regulator n=1 Tax=Ketobacter sp. TaxID=2083498 RepID=UPI000F1EC313|nr:winged helix-turn-helix transcriptional regulator [Ketobacter sp.]RLT96769.1 MAG: transcriptional regulator [Ketobacter sp.]